MKKDVLHTSGELRSFLLGLLYEVRHDRIPLETASVLVQIANTINGTINAETRARAVSLMAGEHLADFGQLLIGNASPAPPLSAPPSALGKIPCLPTTPPVPAT